MITRYTMNIAKKNLTTLAEACEKMPLYTRTEYEKLKAENAELQSQVTNMKKMMRLLVHNNGADSHVYSTSHVQENVFQENKKMHVKETDLMKEQVLPRRSTRLAELAARSSQ